MKKRFRRGFTLTELLIAVLLLALVSVMAAVMTTAVLSTTVTIQEISQAEILGSEALENLQRELRFAQGIGSVTIKENEKENEYFKFDADAENKNYVVLLSDGNAISDDGPIPAGMIMLTQLNAVSAADGTTVYSFNRDDEKLVGVPLFGGVSYGKNLTIEGLKFKIGTDKVEVSLNVKYGEKTLWSGGVSVRPLAGI